MQKTFRELSDETDQGSQWREIALGRLGKKCVVGPVVLLGLLKVAMLFELQWQLRARVPFVCFNMSNKVIDMYL